MLGPLLVEDARGPVDVKGPRHRAVLARLLIAHGRVVPVDRLVDDLWENPPVGAVGAIQTFVAALRRALEPDRPPRTPARLLVTSAPGYALRAAPDRVDARRFEAAVTGCAELLARRQGAAALARMDQALALWRGPAYAEFSEMAWARTEIGRLDELQRLGRQRRAEALLALGRATEAVLQLEIQVEDNPWREDGWQLLALALYRAGRQGDALGALRRARRVLVQELGVDPGPGLRQLESDILDQAAHLSAPVEAAHRPGTTHRPPERPEQLALPVLIGRDDETAQLVAAATVATQQRRVTLVLVSGDAGAGKTTLAEAFSARLAAQGWTTAWGGSPEHEGVPAAWAWSQLLDGLAATGGEAAPVIDPAGADDPVASRFHWHRAVANHLGRVARHSPLLLVLDDLHWAGEETLALLTSVITESPAQPVLAIATYRTTDVSAGLAELLGRVARAEPTRIYLGGLPVAAVSDLVRSTIGTAVDSETAGVIHRRSTGNPFFVRELARLFDTEGPAGLAAVPPGVRDVVRHRLGALAANEQAILQQAAVIGTEIDLDLLTALTRPAALNRATSPERSSDPEGADNRVLEALESATRRGFLVERGPRRFQFAHALVRDTLYQDLSRSRRAQWHAAAAEMIERLCPDDVDALAHHFVQAEDPALADRTTRYARAAAERAEQRCAPHEAVRLWQAALTAFDRRANQDDQASPDDDLPGRLELIMGLVRALAVSGNLARARQHRATAITLAEQVDDPRLTARVIGAFDVPAIWTDNDDPVLAHRIVAATERTLAALPTELTAERCRLLATLAVELRNTGGDRARSAAREAETLARSLDDPAVLGFALNARFLQTFERAGLAPERARIGTELLVLATGPALVTFQLLGHLILVQSHSALADFTSADEHAAIADRLAGDYRLPLVSVFTGWYRALRSAVTGPPTEAAAGYRAAATGLTGTDMAGLDNGILPLALLCAQIQQGRRPDPDPDTDFGGYQDWCRPLVLLAAGRRDEARSAARSIPDSPRDLLYEARTCLHALVALELDDHPTMARLYTELRPAAGELAGAGSGLLTLRPVAHYLGNLATALGRPDQAATHRHQADALESRLTRGSRTTGTYPGI